MSTIFDTFWQKFTKYIIFLKISNYNA